MSQTREKWVSIVLSRSDFWMIWRCYDIPCFHFYFLFRSDGKREQLDGNDFRRCYGFFSSKVSFRKYFITAFSFSSITRHLANGIWKTPGNWIFYEYGSAWASSLQQDIWLTIVCFSFSQASLVLKFNLVLIE